MAAVSQPFGRPGYRTEIAARRRLHVLTDATCEESAASERVAPIRAIGATRRLSNKRRRLASTAATVAALTGLWIGTGALAPGAHPATRPAELHTASGLAYIVKPGDTLWSIASAIATDKDRAAVVGALRAELHGASLRPGSVLRVP
ncbi:MAG TPA: LysM peptidoglycan-binding domain-containing protein [Acidimicrobiales bacterium]|nr:LysM peptidoglycan-binding domain-containing protein [Acidimicrobiales bacterium]